MSLKRISDGERIRRLEAIVYEMCHILSSMPEVGKWRLQTIIPMAKNMRVDVINDPWGFKPPNVEALRPGRGNGNR